MLCWSESLLDRLLYKQIKFYSIILVLLFGL